MGFTWMPRKNGTTHTVSSAGEAPRAPFPGMEFRLSGGPVLALAARDDLNQDRRRRRKSRFNNPREVLHLRDLDRLAT
jgi:hypothetical protein